MAAARPRRLLLYLAAFGTVLFWGASFPLSKAALAFVGPIALAFLRAAVSAVALLVWLALTRRLPVAGAVLRRDLRALSWVALIGLTLFYFLENIALRYTTATNAGVLSNLTSVFIVILGVITLRERPRASEWLAMMIAFAGAALVSQGSGHFSLDGAGLFGDGLMLLAVLFAAIYSVAGKRLVGTYSPDVVMALVAALGALFLLPLALLEGLTLILPLNVWGAVLILGLGAGALANLWWLRLLAVVPAARASMILFLIPIISTVISVTALGEPLTLTMVLGGLLVLVGMGVVQSRRVVRDA